MAQSSVHFTGMIHLLGAGALPAPNEGWPASALAAVVGMKVTLNYYYYKYSYTIVDIVKSVFNLYVSRLSSAKYGVAS